LKQVLPWRSLNSAAEIDPSLTLIVHRSSRDVVFFDERSHPKSAAR
jgi:hypothetical protein